MDNILLDICITLILAVGAVLTWRWMLKRKTLYALLTVMIVGLSLRVYLSSDPYLHEWDERYHALVAKNMVDHPLKPTLFEHPVIPYEKDNWISSHLWLSKPPVPLLTIAASVAAFGDNVWAVRLPSVLLSMVAVYITFLLGRRLFGERAGIVGAFLHAIHGLILECVAGRVSSDHVETFFITFVELAVYFVVLSLRKKGGIPFIILAGIFTGLAFLSKWFPALIVFPVWFVAILLARDFSWKRFLLHGFLLVLSTGIIALPWIAEVNAYGDSILYRVLFSFNEVTQDHQEYPLFYWHQIMILFGEGIYIAIGMAVFFLVKRQWKLSNALLLTWILIPLIVFTLAETKRYTYILIAAPAFFLLISNLVIYLSEHYRNAKRKWMSVIVLLVMLLLPIRYTVERLKLFQEKDGLPDFYVNRGKWEGRFDDNDLVFGLPANIELMFHTEVKAAYHVIPEEEDLERLQKEGHDVYIYREGEFTLMP